MSLPLAQIPTANIADVGTLGTILSPISDFGQIVGTIGTILAGNMTSSIIGGILQDIGTVGNFGTIGTIISIVSTRDTIGSITPISYFSGTTSGTIKGTAGNLWGLEAINQSPSTAGGTATATLILLNYQSGLASALATIIAEIQIPPKDFRSRDLSRPISFGTLIASGRHPSKSLTL